MAAGMGTALAHGLVNPAAMAVVAVPPAIGKLYDWGSRLRAYNRFVKASDMDVFNIGHAKKILAGTALVTGGAGTGLWAYKKGKQ